MFRTAVIALCVFSLGAVGLIAKGKPAAKPQYVITVTQGGKTMGQIVIETMPEVAPKMCKNFDQLVKSKFYNGCAFHRVIPNFMIQGGDPNSKDKPRATWGQGDPSQKNVDAEFNNVSHLRGIVSTARAQDPNSGNSQFFIMVADAPRLDHQYTVFAKVISGMEIADKIVNSPRDSNDNPNDKIEMNIKRK